MKNSSLWIEVLFNHQFGGGKKILTTCNDKHRPRTQHIIFHLHWLTSITVHYKKNVTQSAHLKPKSQHIWKEKTCYTFAHILTVSYQPVDIKLSIVFFTLCSTSSLQMCSCSIPVKRAYRYTIVTNGWPSRAKILEFRRNLMNNLDSLSTPCITFLNVIKFQLSILHLMRVPGHISFWSYDTISLYIIHASEYESINRWYEHLKPC